jgi:predicted ferric reductase
MANAHRSHIRPSSEQWVSRSWWVIVFVVLGSLFYLYAIKQKDQTYKEMTIRLRGLEREKEMALVERQDLLLQIDSQADPAWVEMVLKRNLGLVPEGQRKVYFHKD